MQVVSIVSGGNSILVSRNYDGGGIGSLAAGGTLRVKAPSAPEGDEHTGPHGAAGQPARERGGLLQGGDRRPAPRWGQSLRRRQLRPVARQGVARSPGAARSGSADGRVERHQLARHGDGDPHDAGASPQLTSINSTVVDASFSANPHLYIGDAMQNAFNNGAATTESWGIIAARSTSATSRT
jgi:hypothetical protein